MARPDHSHLLVTSHVEAPEAAAIISSSPSLPRRARVIRPGIRLTIRGRSLKLRRLRQPPLGLWRWFAILGPGLIASVAGDDAGGIATSSLVGARVGYDLLWLLIVLTVALAVVQEMAARLGVATGSGLLDLIRQRFGIGWALLAVTVLLVANAGVTATEFLGIAAGAELFGLSRWVAVPVAGIALWALMLYGNYFSAERIFLAMTLVFLAYPIAALLAQPDWAAVVHGAVVPSMNLDQSHLALVIALIGTTITPYQQLFQQSAVVEKGVGPRHYVDERVDAYFGAIVGNLIWFFVICATAAALRPRGITDIGTASEAARALEPLAGPAAQGLFAFGLLGASLLAGAVVPLATAFSVSEAFGFRKGFGLDYRRAPIFYGLFTGLVAFGGLVALIPSVPIISLLVGIQVLNGFLLPIVLGFILVLAGDSRSMGKLANTPLQAILGWVTLIGVTAAALLLALRTSFG
jgi:NRAMP (natural resistance-associated macrophage protein)-like metal ion transporter